MTQTLLMTRRTATMAMTLTMILGGAEATRVLRDAVANDQLMDAERSHGIRALAMIDSDEARASLADLDTRRLAKPVAEELQHARDRGTD